MYILLETIHFVLNHKASSIQQYTYLPTLSSNPRYSYIFYTFSLFRGYLSSFSSYPPSITSSSSPPSVVSRGHSRSLIQGKNTFFFSLLAKQASTEKEKKKKVICWLVGSLSREKEGIEAFVSVIEKRKYPPSFPAYRRSTCSLL